LEAGELDDFLAIVFAGEDEDFDEAEGGVFADALDEGVAVELGHAEVEDGEVWAEAGVEAVDGFLSVLGLDDFPVGRGFTPIMLKRSVGLISTLWRCPAMCCHYRRPCMSFTGMAKPLNYLPMPCY
jgi:hypothetical protein